MNSAMVVLSLGILTLLGVVGGEDLIICPKIACYSPCYFNGVRLIGNDGCPTCDCYPNPCKNHHCPPGQRCYLEPVTCITSPCPPQPVCYPCPQVRCSQYCPGGYKLDRNGCQTCECKREPCPGNNCPPGERCVTTDVECISPPCPPEQHCEACPPVCEMACPFGLDVDNDGCEICKCRDSPCKNKHCPPGEGCVVAYPLCIEGSKCGPFGMCVDCPQLRCGGDCPYGFADMYTGCPGCECLPNPCDSVDCPEGKICITKEMPCWQGWGCPHKARCVSKNSNHVACPEIGDISTCEAPPADLICLSDEECAPNELCCKYNACNSAKVCKKFVLGN